MKKHLYPNKLSQLQFPWRHLAGLRVPLILLLVLFSTAGQAQKRLVTWNFQEAPQPIADPFLATANDARMVSTPINRGAGVVPDAYANSFVASGWDAANLQDAIAKDDYLQFTVTSKEFFQVSLYFLHATVYRGENGPTRYRFQYSLNGFATPGVAIGPQGVFGTTESGAEGRVQNPPLDLRSLADLQNLSGGSLVTIRMYAWGALNAESTFGFYHRNNNTDYLPETPLNVANLGIDGVVEAQNPGQAAYVWQPINPGTPAEESEVGPEVAGATVGNWNIPENSVPNRINPEPTDILLFDSGTRTLVSGLQAGISAHQLVIRNNTDVTFQPSVSIAGGTPPSSLTLTAPTPAFALSVEAGSTLRFLAIQGTRTLEMRLSPNTLALIGGRVVFDSAPSVAGQEYVLRQANHRLLATDPEAIIFQSGSVFEANKFSGHPFGNHQSPDGYDTPGTVVFQAGATYRSRGGLSPFGLANTPSKARFAPGSLFLLEDYDFAPLVAGNTFGDLVINLSAAAPAKQNLQIQNVESPEPLVLDNFTLEQGTITFPLTASTSLQYLNIQVKGSFNVTNDAVFNYTTPAPSTLSFVGTMQPQTIGGTGQLVMGPNTTLQINTPASVTLNRELTMDGTLQLTQGTLFTSGLNSLLTISPSGSIDGGNTNSFIDGPLRLGVATANPTSLIFPLGHENFAAMTKVYRPVTLDLTLDAASLTYFTAALIPGAPTPDRALPADDVPPGGLENVSSVRHYTIVQEGPTTLTEGSITLSFGTDDNVTDLPNLRIATANTEPTWINLGQASATAPGDGSPLGFITATLPDASQFGTFVLANAIGGTNPLPVQLVSFTAQREQAAVALRWTTASEQNNKGYEVLRSQNGVDWEKLSFISGQGTTHRTQQYAFTDRTAPASAKELYYRLKQVDLDGTASFSQVVAVSAGGSGSGFAVFPNPAAEVLHVQLEHISEQAILRISNLLGQTVLEKTYGATSNQISEPLSNLPNGTYLLEVQQGQQRFARRFVKVSR